MEPHPLHLISYATWDFRSLSKDDIRVGRHDLNFRIVKTFCNSHPFPRWVTLRLQPLHFPFWSDLERFSLSSGFCSDASNDFIHTFAIITASDAPIARPSDCICQIPLHLKWTFVTASFSKLFMADLGISGARFLNNSKNFSF